MNILVADLKQPEIVSMLKGYGFTGLHLTSHDKRTSTYTYVSMHKGTLDKTLGHGSVTSNGKVVVYKVPGAGRLGLSPSNGMVRFIDESTTTGPSAPTHHLANITVPAAFEKAYMQAQANPAVRVKFCQKLFDHFNKEKFHGDLPTPSLKVSDAAAKRGTLSKTVRGVYYPGQNFGPGNLWMASFMFNARPAFFYEVFLHEMCHCAAWTISKSQDRSEAGHGPVWQDWMKKVGLDPRRFDPTDDYAEYKLGPEKYAKEAERTQKYGPAPTEQELKKYEKYEGYTGNPVPGIFLLYEGRLFSGTAQKNVFKGKNINTGVTISLKYKTIKSLGNSLYTKP